MNYSVQNLTQISDCDALLAWAQREKNDLNFKKLSDERLTVKYNETSIEIEAELQSVNSQIAMQESIIAVLPDGPTKQEAINKKTRLEYKKFLLQTRKESYGAVALLEKEMELARVIQELEEVEEFITAVTDKKAGLAA